MDHDRRIYGTMENVGKGPREYSPDQKIRDQICELLYWDPEVDASEMEVKVRNHFVFLEGKVDSRHAKKRAEQLIETVPGVFDVFNRLVIKSTLDVESDKIIARGEDGLYSSETIQR